MLCLLLLVLAAAPVVDVGPGRVEVDWSAGELRVTGAAAADLRQPNPGVARVAAERLATERAQKLLAEAVYRLPVAKGGTVAQVVKRDAAARGRVDSLLGTRLSRRVHYASDGGTEVTLILGLHSVACAVTGDAASPAGKATLVVAQTVKPALGVELESGGVVYRGPVRFVREAPSAPAPLTADALRGANLVIIVIKDSK